MKKTIFLVAMITVAMGVNAQWFDFSNNKGRCDIGFQLGQTGIGTDFNHLGFGASIDIYGVYIDFLSEGPMHKYDNQIAVGSSAMVPDSTVLNINLGYQIPVLPWLRIMPIVGYCYTTHGHTDLSTLNTEVDVSGDYVSVELTHDYIKEGSFDYWNYGGGIVVQPIKWLNIYGVYSTRSIYGGIAISLSALYNSAKEPVE